MLSKSNGFRLGVIFCTVILLASTLPIGVSVLGETEDEEDIVLVKIDGDDQMETLNSMDLNIIDRYNRYVLVEADGSSIEELQEANLDVDTLPARTEISVKGHRFDIEEGEPELNSDLMIDGYPEGSMGTYIINLLGPVNPDWVEQLEDMDVKILNYVPNYAYEVRMTPEMRERVEELEFVDWTGIYHPQYRIAEEIELAAEEDELDRVRVRLVPDADLRYVDKILNLAPQARFTDDSGFGLETIIEVDDVSTVQEIARMQDVYYVSDYEDPELHSEVDSHIIGGGAWIWGDEDEAYREYGDHGAYINQIGYTGEGVTIAIADSGIGDGTEGDAGHPDFTGRVIGGWGYETPAVEGDWTDDHLHGTHMAGSAAGNTYEGKGTQHPGHDGEYYAGQGLAYDSELFAQKIYGWDGIRWEYWPEGDEFQVVEDAKQKADADIHVNAWGRWWRSQGGFYDAVSEKLDRATRDSNRDSEENEPMVILASAGNDGDNKYDLYMGDYQHGVVATPSIGKNVMSIGMTESYLPDIHDYVDWPGVGSIDNPDRVSGASSRGWAYDGRVKPDLVAPGRGVLSTNSPEGWSGIAYSPDGDYRIMEEGSSKANALASGAAAVVMEWYEENYGEKPSPAMVKALMINTAQPLEEDQTGVGIPEYIPNLHEGWGMIDVSKLERPKEDPVPISVSDQNMELETGEMDEHLLDAAKDGSPLNITVTWTDEAAMEGDDPALKNNLNLRVESPSGKVYYANAFADDSGLYSTKSYTYPDTDTMTHFDPAGDGEDEVNNVLNIFIPPEEVEEGTYTVEVEGANVPADANNNGQNSQDYALVAYNSDMIPAGDPPSVELEFPEGGEEWEVDEEIDIQWTASQGDDPIDTIYLDYSTDGGESWEEIDEVPADTNSYEWTIPWIGGESEECLVRVRAEDTVRRSSQDENEDYFTITYPFETPVLDVTTPEDGDVFSEEDLPITARWESDHTNSHEIRLNEEEWIDKGMETEHTFDEIREGHHELEVKAIGEEETYDKETVSFVVDMTPPDIKIDEPKEGEMFPEDSVTVSWNSSDEITHVESHQVRIEGGRWLEPDEVTTHTFDNLADGYHVVDIQAVDQAGNERIENISFTVDTTPPDIEITEPGQGAKLNDDPVTIRWDSSDEITSLLYHEIKLNGELIGEDIDPGATRYELPNLEDGDHDIEIIAVDQVENKNSDMVSFTLDTKQPELEVVFPDPEEEEKEMFGESTVTIEWDATPQGTDIVTYEVKLEDDEEWETADGETGHTFEDLEDGEREVEIRVIDEAGNEETRTVTFKVDTVDPEVEITRPHDGYTTNEDSVVIEWHVIEGYEISGIEGYEVRREGYDWLSMDEEETSRLFERLDDGEHTFDVIAIDRAGNEGSYSITITVDTTAPELDITSPRQGSETDENSVTVEWDATPEGTDIDEDSYEIRINDGEWIDVGGETSHTFEDLEDGDYTVEIRVTDDAGNEDRKTVEFTVDTFSILDYWWLMMGAVIVAVIAIGAVWKKKSSAAKERSQEEEQEQEEEEEEEYFCADCGQPVKYIEEHERWYCETCDEYK